MHTASQAPPICQEDENEGVQGGVMGREGKTGESGSEGVKGGRRSDEERRRRGSRTGEVECQSGGGKGRARRLLQWRRQTRLNHGIKVKPPNYHFHTPPIRRMPR